MIKISKFLVLSLVIIGGFLLPTGNADAAWSGWKSASAFGNTCEVRVYTDLTTYTKVANTVDTKAETRGTCSRIYYTMSIPDPRIAWGGIGETYTGYFSSSTPLKKININDVDSQVQTKVVLDMYKDSGLNNHAGEVFSSTITIQNQK